MNKTKINRLFVLERARMKILVVDDEPLVRRGIISMLEQDVEEAEIVGEAGSGSAAVKIIEKENPDVVLTDIIMPSMNGIELLKWMMLNRPKIKSVVLSCHQEFQYVKDSFLYGAVDYILKYGIDTQALKKMIESLKKALSENKKIAGFESVDFIDNDLDMIKSSFLRNIINSRIVDEAEILSKAKKYQLSVSLIEPSYILSIAIDNKQSIDDDKKDAYVKEFQNITKSISSNCNFELIYEGQHSFIVLLQPKDSGFSIEKACTSMQKKIESRFNFCVSVGVSDKGYNFKHYSEMLSSAKKGLEQKFFYGSSSIVFSRDMKEQSNDSQAKAIKKSIMESINELNLSDALLKLKKLYDFLKTGECCTVLQAKLIYISLEEALINVIRDRFKDFTSSNKEILESEFLFNINSLLKEKLIFASNQVINIIDTRNCPKPVYKTVVFINSYYSDSTISLEMIAGKFGYTSAYLSRLFKKETGKNLVDYVNEVRIFAAKKLLKQNDKKVYQVAEQVGYSNYNYFSKVFKQYVGVSPSEFS